MAQELSLSEIVSLRDFINLNVGGEIGIVRGKIVPATPIPSADGYAVIAWVNEVHGWEDSREPIVKFGSFYPKEEVKRRFKERKENSHILSLYKDSTLIREGNLFRFSQRNIGQSFYSQDDLDYGQYSQRLKQEELALTA